MKFKRVISFLKNDWVITLTATLIGVFVALYLNEMVASDKLEKQKSIATSNIFLEIEHNRAVLEKNINKLEVLLATIEFMDTHMTEDDRLISSVESMTNFRYKYPGVFKVQDSTLLENGLYHYRGESQVDFNPSHINLTTLAFKTLKSSGLSSSYDFNCLIEFEKYENFTGEMLQFEQKAIDAIYEAFENNQRQELMIHISGLIEFEQTLLQFYEEVEKILETCD